MAKKSICGQRSKMQNGMYAEVIADRGAFDIDIQFQDGTIVEHRSRGSFKKGLIANPKLPRSSTRSQATSIVGLSKKMNCGMLATVIADRGSKDIDIKFEDGTVVTHKRRDRFRSGEIAGPSTGSILGNSNKMNCGVVATVVADRGSTDIDVVFDNGLLVCHKTRTAFKRGNISFTGAYKKNITGQIRIMNCGMKATVIKDNGWDNIDVQFEDGAIVYKQSRAHFMSGAIVNPNLGRFYSLKKDATGETKKMNCGMQATVIHYRNADDIDVKFEDGTIVTNKKISHFRNGLIRNPNYDQSSIKGQQRVMKCGMLCIVTEDRGFNDIDVEFVDGTILKHISRKHFLDGKLANPNLGKLYTKTKNTNILGQTRLMNCGMEATVIVDRGAKDIDVKFDDGTIVEHVRRGNFIRNKIDNPNYDKTSLIGKERILRNGQRATVIDDRGWNDIDIQFEDGTIKRHLYRSTFIAGCISNPLLPVNSLPEMLIYNCIHKYFPHAQRDFRPDWLKNPNTGINFEIDVWIPEKKIGIEYDGFPWHCQETQRSKTKYNLIVNSEEIDKMITVLEKGTILHTSPKHINYQLSCISRRDQYKELLEEIKDAISMIFGYLDVDGDVDAVDDALKALKDPI